MHRALMLQHCNTATKRHHMIPGLKTKEEKRRKKEKQRQLACRNHLNPNVCHSTGRDCKRDLDIASQPVNQADRLSLQPKRQSHTEKGSQKIGLSGLQEIMARLA